MKQFEPAPNCNEPSQYGRLRADEALQQILDCLRPVNGSERIPLSAAVDRVLAETIVAPGNVPAHTNAAVDGYAVNSADLQSPQANPELEVIDTALAGRAAQMTLKPGNAIRIMTGAVLPQGADTVLMQETVETKPGSIRLHAEHRRGENVRRAGEDIQQGDSVLNRNHQLSPADIGLLASLGISEVKALQTLRVGVLSTGDELKGPGALLGDGEIYDSNRHSLQAGLRRLGIKCADYGIVRDNKESLESAIDSARQDNHLVIASGGVSVGEADYTREILQAMGEIHFSKVAIKPGRPLTFATIYSTPFFGLPGNPVAVMVTFYQFVLPALKKLMGMDPIPQPLMFKARAMSPIRKNPGRTEYQRAIVTANESGDWSVRLTGRQGSGILRSMSLANAFIVLPHDASNVAEGDQVLVQPFVGFN